MRIVQRGPAACPLVLGWFLAPTLDAMLRAALPGCTILADVGRDLRPDLAAIRAMAPEATGPVVVVCWSAGCQSGRYLAIHHPDKIAGAVMLDGTSDALPIGGPEVDVWRAFAAEARAGRNLFVAACSGMSYTEAIRDDPKTAAKETPFASTRHVLEAALGVPLPAGAEVHDGWLHVYSIASDEGPTEAAGAVHRWMVNVLLERVLRAHVGAWLAAPAMTASGGAIGDTSLGVGDGATTSATTATPPLPSLSATPTLRRKAKGPAVRALQVLLVRHGHALTVDGDFGGETEKAVRAFQSAHAGLTVDGVAGPKTWAALAEEPGAISSPATSSSVRGPLTAPERNAIFGTFGFTANQDGSINILGTWARDNIVSVTIPQLAGIEGAPKSGAIPLHRLVAEQTRALFAAWEAAGLMPLVLTWAGSWAPRFVRGSTTTMSNHAFATAFDINAPQNGLGRPAAPRGTKGSVIDLVPLAETHGFFWGGRFSRPDPMHFEANRIV